MVRRGIIRRGIVGLWFSNGCKIVTEPVIAADDYIGMAKCKNGTYEIVVLARDLFEKKIKALNKHVANQQINLELASYRE